MFSTNIDKKSVPAGDHDEIVTLMRLTTWASLRKKLSNGCGGKRQGSIRWLAC